MPTTPTTELEAEVAANCKAMSDRGYTKVSRLDHHQGDFNRMIALANRRFGANHRYMHHHFVEVARTDLTWARFLGHDENKLLTCTGYWCPTWMLTLVDYERQWRKDARAGRADAADHDEIIEVLHKGLCGDHDTVDAFLCLKELANEGRANKIRGILEHLEYLTINDALLAIYVTST